MGTTNTFLDNIEVIGPNNINTTTWQILLHRLPFMKKSTRSFRTSLVAMLLLLAGVESNPGPVGPVGHVNSNEMLGSVFRSTQCAIGRA